MRPPFSRTYFDVVVEMAGRDPHAIAVIDRGRLITYRDLARRSGQVAAALRAQGLARGHRVAILLDNRMEWLEIMLGATALGCIAVPLSTWATKPELEFLLRDADARVLFTLGTYAGHSFAGDILALVREKSVPAFSRIVVVEGNLHDGLTSDEVTQWRRYEDTIEHEPLGALPPGEGARAGDTAVILYTSGSGSRPKAVPLDHFAAIENGFNIGERMGLSGADRVLLSAPLFWSYGGINALPATFTHGAALVLQSRFEPGEALDLIEAHKCTALYTLPAMTSALVGHPAFRLERTASLRTGLTIGSAQDVIKAADELGAREICNIYGSTETYGNCCVTWHHWPLEMRAACQGVPLPGVDLRIVHPETNVPCAPGEHGNVEVAGYLTRGYINASADQNAGTFTDDGYFRTGDLGTRTLDGAFVFAGRSSEIIKRSGINVSPAEVEEVLQQHPEVGLAGVVGLADAEKGELIIAHVVPKPGFTPSPEALIAHCKALASRYKVPDRVVIVEALPLTPTGKVMRRELKALVGKPN
jgi:fatty-acyl-CoA synthase